MESSGISGFGVFGGSHLTALVSSMSAVSVFEVLSSHLPIAIVRVCLCCLRLSRGVGSSMRCPQLRTRAGMFPSGWESIRI